MPSALLFLLVCAPVWPNALAQQLERRPAKPAVMPSLAVPAETAVKSVYPTPPPPDRNAILAGTPLWIKLDHSAPVRTGALISGHLTENVYSVDHLLLPAGSRVTGHIAATPPVDHATRRTALLNGDFTPLKQPEMSFDSVILPDGRNVPISANATQRDETLIAMQAATLKKPSRVAALRANLQARVQGAREIITGPHKGERIQRFAYGQLPWHPQKAWSDTGYVADLTSPTMVPPLFAISDGASAAARHASDAPSPVADLTAAQLKTMLPQMHLEARMTEDVSSATAKQGDPVVAILTRPVFTPKEAATDAQPRLIFPEGTRLTGAVIRSKAARSWGRNGALRFTFHSIDVPAGTVEVQGQVAAIDGTKGQNLTVDSEGGTKANPDKNRFLGPLTLALMANGAADTDHVAAHSAVAGNGFGLVARLAVIAIATPGATLGLAIYDFSKSIYGHFIARGHDVAFQQDTRLIIDVVQH